MLKGPTLAAVLLSALVTGCGSSASPTASPRAPSRESAAPSAEALVTPQGSAPLEPNYVAQVITTDLVMRSAPGGGPDSDVYPGALDAPTLLFIVDGPVTASGYDWYLVYPFLMSAADDPPDHWRLAWVAAGSRDGEAWIAPAAPDCPRPDFSGLTGLSGIGALGCYSDRPITLDGSFGGSSYIVPLVTSPPWLTDFSYELRPLGTAPDAPRPGLTIFYFHVPDQAGTLNFDVGSPIQVVGHFDDPAAQTCVRGQPPGPEPTPGPIADEILRAQFVVLSCRAHFVVTEATPLAP